MNDQIFCNSNFASTYCIKHEREWHFRLRYFLKNYLLQLIVVIKSPWALKVKFRTKQYYIRVKKGKVIRVRLLTMCRAELSAVITRLTSKCL